MTTLNSQITGEPALRRAWFARAACRNTDPDVFFPIGTGPAALADVAQAKRVCRTCPVARDCLAWAMATGQTGGVWGGMTEDERRTRRRARVDLPAQLPDRRRRN